MAATVVGAAAWFGFGVAVNFYWFEDVCGDAIRSLAPIGVWIAMLVGGTSMSVGSTALALARRANGHHPGWGRVVATWFVFGVSVAWFVAVQVGLPSSCDYGRPARDHDGAHLLPAVRHRRHPRRRGAHRAAGRHWLRVARGECASIGAFRELERVLVSAGAPDALADRCRVAARDEMRHTALAADLVERFTGARPTFVAVEPPQRTISIVELAVESWFDGCLNEGAAAAEAAVRADAVEDLQIRTVLRVIAADEAQHADLAWAVIEWCLTQEPDAVAQALCSAASRRPVGDRGIPRPWWLGARRAVELGWIDAELCAEVAPRVLAAARQRLAHSIGSPVQGSVPQASTIEPSGRMNASLMA
jgi:hypothetical protein